jgi:adenine specific DNA methylase Mod
MNSFKEEKVINTEPVLIYTINNEFAEKLLTLELKKIENRIKKIKIDTTIADVDDLFEEEARVEVKRKDVPLEDARAPPHRRHVG